LEHIFFLRFFLAFLFIFSYFVAIAAFFLFFYPGGSSC